MVICPSQSGCWDTMGMQLPGSLLPRCVQGKLFDLWRWDLLGQLCILESRLITEYVYV